MITLIAMIIGGLVGALVDHFVNPSFSNLVFISVGALIGLIIRFFPRIAEALGDVLEALT
jgi:hypothetical protein